MVLHYQAFIKSMKSCPILIAYGPSGMGRTTALQIAGIALVAKRPLPQPHYYRTALCSESTWG